jgi:hypothetical protein
MHNRFNLPSSVSLLALVTILSSCTGQVVDGSQAPVSGDDPSGSPDASPTSPPDGGVAPLPDGGGVAPSPDGGSVSPPPGSNPAPMAQVDFAESSAELVNPERGFYVGVNLLSSTSAAQARASGHSLAIAEVHLDAYRDRPLDDALLSALDAGFDRVRSAGIKVVLRFAYNESFDADAPKAIILGHIAQLKPLLQKHADVIAVLQAGFIGAWGEWHSSTNGLDNDADHATILNALLDALPASRAVQVRTPMDKAGVFGSSAALGEAEAFTGTPRARTGHHNDCFLASASDFGTYDSPIDQWEAYVAAETRFVPMGGETCGVSARTECGVAVGEMTSNHWSYLNEAYHQDVLAGWQAQGCYDDITRSLGYRFVLTQVRYSESVAPGGELALELNLANTGFAAPFNKRPVYIVLSGAGARRVARLETADVRRWQRGESVKITTRLRVPASAAPGTYQLALWMPDDATTLRDDPRYGIQLANAGVWNSATGDNVLARDLVIDASAPGTVDHSASAFAELH